MTYLSVSIESGIATLTLDGEGAAVNTVSPGWIDAMVETFQRLKGDSGVRGIIVTSGKPGFMAGADLKYILNETAHFSERDAFAFSQRATKMHRLVETCGKPVVAAINGFALGGGYELALACHRRIVANDGRASVGLPEVNVGLLPGSGGTQRLARMIGALPALDVLLTGASYRPEEALKRGLVDELAPGDQLLSHARAWIEGDPVPVQPWDRPDQIVSRGQDVEDALADRKAALLARYGANYPAPFAILACVAIGCEKSFEEALTFESEQFARLMTDPRTRNIIRTTFVNKGLAEKGSRRPPGFEKTKVAKIGVLGAGMMGAGIAYAAANAGIDVVLLDMSAAAAAKGKAYAERILAKQVEKGAKSREAADAILSRITPTQDYGDLKGCELVVEAVFEDTAIKADVVKKAEAVLGADAIFASNTSTLPITKLAEASQRPESFIGLHFFSPVERMDLVEVIRGRATSDATLARGLDFVAQLRKTPIVVNDSRGFYTSRVFQTFIHEGAAMVGEGVDPALIEEAAKAIGMPIGPLALLDEVTLDLPLKIVGQAIAEEGEAYTPPCGAPVMRRMKDALGRSSRKAGGAFYTYSESGKALWSGLPEAFPRAAQQPDAEEVGKRLLYVQALETARCLEEGVLTHAADADLGAVLGWGFPSWTGGTLSLIDTVGLERFVAECDRLAQAYGPRFAPTAQLRAMAEARERFHPICAA